MYSTVHTLYGKVKELLKKLLLKFVFMQSKIKLGSGKKEIVS